MKPIAEEGDEVFSPYINSISKEGPKIADSVKNLISILMAQSSAGSPSSADFALSPSQVMALARALLLTIQSHSLLSVTEFCEKNPQQDGETGLARLEDVLRYKCAYAMREHCLRNNDKISKLFGVSYFKWTKCWPDIRQKTVELVERTSNPGTDVNNDELKMFLDLYEKSIMESSSSSSSSSSNSYANVVWAVDFSAALRERQLLRTAEASLRPIPEVEGSEEGKFDNKEKT